MTTSRHKRSKSYGYEVEKAAEAALSMTYPRIARKGSVAYKKDAADLEQEGTSKAAPYRFIVTRDKRRPMLITMSMEDFYRLAGPRTADTVYVQVKGRAKTWIGGLYEALRKATL